MNNYKFFKGKKILITGGTGSFGNAITVKLLKAKVSEIKIFSRDEKKQDDMRKSFSDSRLKFILGDIRDYRSIKKSVENVDFIFHAAALKQVPSCEFFPMEAVKTNVLGAENLIDASIESGVKKIICLSTDKAVQPINAMGLSKALMEKVIIAKSREIKSKKTKICITRYGNVIYSRGSVIPLFVNQLTKDLPLTITDLKMTRFMMSMDDAIDLVLFAFANGKNGEVFIRKAPGASIDTILESLKLIFKKNIKYKIIGSRHGEKKHEILMSKEEKLKSKNYKHYYKILSDSRDLNYDKFFTKGKIISESVKDYTSSNTEQLSKKQLALILKPIIQKYNKANN